MRHVQACAHPLQCTERQLRLAVAFQSSLQRAACIEGRDDAALRAQCMRLIRCPIVLLFSEFYSNTRVIKIYLTRRRSDSPTLYSTIKFEKGPGKDYEKDVLILPSMLGKNLHTPFGRLLGC